MKLVTVVGARPQFIKAAAFSRVVPQARGRSGTLEEVIVHTGQHYDPNMSDVFFEDLGIPRPRHHLGIGSGAHGAQTGRMLEKIESVLEAEKPDAVLVYGDTNSTLAAALAAAKMHIAVAHVEAGLRSFNRRMPEEVNRVLTDHLSRWLFCPTDQSVTNLEREGITEGVHQVGDIMFDSMRFHERQVMEHPRALPRLGLEPRRFVLATVHRAENTDSAENLREIFGAFAKIADKYPVVVALHPRTRKFLDLHRITVAPGVRLVEPLPYHDTVELESHARMILTDSGGMQKEAFFVGTRCITLREETEWVETVEAGANRICGASSRRILEAFRDCDAVADEPLALARTPYGAGDAALKIAQALLA